MKPRKPDPLPRIRITLSPADLLSASDLSEMTGGGADTPAPAATARPRPDHSPSDPSQDTPGTLDGMRPA